MKPLLEPHRFPAYSAALLLLTLLGASGLGQSPARAQIAGCRWESAADDLPIGVYDAAGALAEADRALFIQGGIDRDGVVRDDLWRMSLDTHEVQRVVTSGARATRWGHSLTWTDEGGAQLYLMGGNTSQEPGFPAEKRVYRFDPGESSWRISPMAGMPSIQEHAAAYDPESGRVLLQGGCPSNGRNGSCQPQTETYVVDIGASEVIRGQRDGPALAGHSMVYDAAGKRMLIFGGSADGRRGSDDVYELRLDGGKPESAVWQLLTVSGTRPERRFNHGAVYDSARRSMIVYGGLKVDGEPLNDTWALDFSTPGVAVWRDLSLLNQKRSGMVMAYDRQSQLTFMVSGGRPLGSEASKDIFLLRCNNVPTPTPEGGGTPVIGPTSTATATRPNVTPSPTIDPGTNVPPPVTVDPGASVTPSPPPATTEVPPVMTQLPPVATDTPGSPSATPVLPPPEPGRLLLPWLGQSAAIRQPTARPPVATEPPTSGPPPPSETPGGPPAPSETPGGPATQPPRTPLACTSVEREPNDRLLQSLDWPPICEAEWASGSLPEADPGDYFRIKVERDATIVVQLEQIPSDRDYDLLLYDFAGSLLASSQLPRNLDEEIRIELTAEEYALRVYPSTGRSPLAYRLRWSYAP